MLKNLKLKKLIIKKRKSYQAHIPLLILLKNDYIKLKNFGSEELDIYINE